MTRLAGLLVTACLIGSIAHQPLKRSHSGPPVRWVSIDTLRITFSSMGLTDAVHALGPARIFEHGDAGDSESWACYRLKDGRSAMFLTLKAYEGPVAESVTLSRGPWRSATRCGYLATDASQIQLDRGLRLGMTRAELLRIMGTPDSVASDSVVFNYDNHDGAIGRVSARLLGDSVVRLTAFYSEQT
jgi:hypothetical protein